MSYAETAEALGITEPLVKSIEENKGERAQLINRVLEFAIENQPDYADSREYFCAVRILGRIGELRVPLDDMTDTNIERLTREIACMIRFRGNH